MKKEGATEEIKLSEIKSPDFLKTLDYPSLKRLCEEIREEIIRVTSTYGGHLSSNLGAVELTVALHRVFDFKKDKLIFDVGHQCYTNKILTGRSLEHLNQKGYVSGFQNRSESPYDVYDAGHSSTSLSAAEAFAYVRDQKGEDYDVVALIGDASIVNGLSFEALNNIGERHSKVIIVLNDNGMSITKPVGGIGKFFRKISTQKAYNKAKKSFQRAMFRTALGKKIYDFTYRFKRSLKHVLVPTTMFDNMGFTYMGPVNGHSLKQLERTFKRARNATKSVVIHCVTVKGKGYPPAEKDKTGYWHGVTPFDIETGKPKFTHPGLVSWSHYFADLTKSFMNEFPESTLVLPATMKGSGLEECFAEYPKRCLDMGIAEEHAATFSGALAIQGNHPILSIYSTFLQRAYDEIHHDCARMGADMTVLIDRAGLDGKNGATHQGIYDPAYLKSIPNVVITMPSSAANAKALYRESFGHHGVFCLRFPREFLPEEDTEKPEAPLPYLRWTVYPSREEKKLAVLGVGPHGLALKGLLEQKEADFAYFDALYLNPLPFEDLQELASYPEILLYDAYGTKTGFAESVLSSLMELGYSGRIKVLAVPNEFIPFDSKDNQERQFGLLPEQALEAALSLL